jgi:hypothetical protein
MQVIVVLVLIVLIIIALRQYLKEARPDLNLSLRQIGLYAFLVVLAILVLSGRLAWLAALAGAVLALLLRLAPILIQFAPLLARILGRKVSPDPESHRPQPSNPNMSRSEAERILGLSPNPSRADIIDAHRRLIQKLHPDRGGSDYLAAQINQAKKLLLNE